jgi:hypothetical protein
MQGSILDAPRRSNLWLILPRFTAPSFRRRIIQRWRTDAKTDRGRLTDDGDFGRGPKAEPRAPP